MKTGAIIRFTTNGTDHIGYITRLDGDTARVCTAPGKYHTVAVAAIELV